MKVAKRTGPDLLVQQADLAFSPAAPNKGDIVTCSATVFNRGSEDVSNVVIEFSIGDPEAEGTVVFATQSFTMAGLRSMSTTFQSLTGRTGLPLPMRVQTSRSTAKGSI
jgi:hypothetical protein